MFQLRANQERHLEIFRKHCIRPPPPPLTLEEEMALPPEPETGHALKKWKGIGRDLKLARMAAEGKTPVARRRIVKEKKPWESLEEDDFAHG